MLDRGFLLVQPPPPAGWQHSERLATLTGTGENDTERTQEKMIQARRERSPLQLD